MNYAYIEIGEFFKVNKLNCCESKVKGLIKFMEFSRHRNYVLDGFPQTRKQAKIFCEHYCEPFKMLHLHLDKDEVINRMMNHNTDKKVIEGLRAEFLEFLKHNNELFDYVKTSPFYTKLTANHDADAMFKLAMNELNPKVLMTYEQDNTELASTLLPRIQAERGYIHLDYQDLLDCEVKRGTDLGKRIQIAHSENYEHSYTLLRKVFYADPRTNNKYIFSNLPSNVNFLNNFETNVCPFDFVIYLTKLPGNEAENRAQNFNPDYLELIGEYHTKGKLIEVGQDTLEPIDFYAEKTNKYGLLVGATGSGKTTIANSLKLVPGLKVVTYDAYVEELIKKLSTDDNPIETLAPTEVYKHLNIEMNKAPTTLTYLLDGFKVDEEGVGILQNVQATLGKPLFFLRMTTTPSVVLDRYKAKNDVAEPGEEDMANVEKIVQAGTAISDAVDTLVKESFATVVYDIDVTVEQLTTLDHVKDIFMKRVFVVRNLSDCFNDCLLEKRLGFLSVKYGYQFISMSALKNCPANSDLTDPQCAVKVIKGMIDSCKTLNRNVVIYGYLRADKQDEEQKLKYPNSKDELFFLNHHIGNIRACFDFVETPCKTNVDEEMEEKVVQEEVVKPVKAEGEEEEEAPPPEDEEEAKKKFDHSKFDWFKIDGATKTFAQMFNQMQRTTMEQINYSDGCFEELENQFKKIHCDLEEGNENHYYVPCLDQSNNK